ncbi:MAG: helical backbone metal receptor [Bacteroidales bacterium]|nr:helical backbone metal receptor [Bacteroidales bacterium]
MMKQLVISSLAFALCLLVSVVAAAQRVVSLVPSVTQTYMQLGADSYVVARTSYCPPSSNGGSVIVGDAMSVNVEKILAVKPDVVITMELTKPEVIAKLKSFGVDVLELNTPRSFDEICSQTVILARYVGMEETAVRLVSEEKKKVESVARKQLLDKKAFFEIGVKPLWGAVSGTFLDDMLAMLGLDNVVKEGNGSVSREYVVSAKPQYIVMSSLYGQAEEEKSVWRRLLPTAKVVVVDEDTACCPTPSNFRIVISSIVEAFE